MTAATVAPTSAPVGVTPPAATGSKRADTARARRLRSDLRFLRIYSLTTNRVIRYKPHPESVSASEEPGAIADRIEGGLAGEAQRYRLMGWCIFGIVVGPVLLSGILWSGMYWLPVRIYWWPFERGNYGLPFLSLFEWLAYLMLAVYFVLSWALLVTSHSETRKLATEYRRLAEASGQTRIELAAAIANAHPRAEYVVRHSKAFSAYVELMDAGVSQ
jgi:hypothetical protein